jgi:hypothetical protein
MTSPVAAQNETKERTREVFVFPCSFAQRRLWFLHQLDPSNSVYNIVAPMNVSGVLDVAVLKQALNEVVRRHESLRTTFGAVQGEPVQIVACSQTLELEFIDLTPQAPEDRAPAAQQIVHKEAQQPFDLERGPLVRVILVQRSEQDHVPHHLRWLVHGRVDAGSLRTV